MSVAPRVALVVEDEPLIAMLATSILRDLGYTVFEARTAAEALAVLADQPDIAVLFTDVQLADDSSGADLAREVMRTRPAIRVVVTSGRPRPEPFPEGAEFVAKPYTEPDLERAFGG